MYAIAFDMTVREVEARHPRGYQSAYGEIERTLGRAGFKRVQGSVFLSEDNNLSRVTQAMVSLRALEWFPACVRDIRAFRVENWSDFTPFIKGDPHTRATAG